MKSRIALSLALVLSIVLLSLVCFPSAALAAPPQRFTAETGLIIPGPHQKVRITVTPLGNTGLTVRFRQIEYMQDSCNPEGVCKLTISSQTTSDGITLAPGEAASQDLLASTYGRGIVLSNSQDARVTVQIIDTPTGQVESLLVALLLP